MLAKNGMYLRGTLRPQRGQYKRQQDILIASSVMKIKRYNSELQDWNCGHDETVSHTQRYLQSGDRAQCRNLMESPNHFRNNVIY